MPAVQTTYSETITEAPGPGVIASGMPSEVASYEVESTNIDFGVAVKTGTKIGQIVVGVNGAGSAPFAVNDYLGITVENVALGDEVDKYGKGNIASVMFSGDVWVKVEAAVTAGDDVTIKEATGALSSATAADGQFLLPNARYLTTAAANGLAKVRLDSPQKGA